MNRTQAIRHNRLAEKGVMAAVGEMIDYAKHGGKTTSELHAIADKFSESLNSIKPVPLRE